MKGKFLMVFFALLVLPLAYAHQPRIAFDTNNPFDSPIIVTNPEVSKAYYGILKGSVDYYKIESSQPFELYISLVVPQLNDTRTDFIAEISKNGKIMHILNGTNFSWTHFYEEFAGDDYLQGPELDENVSSGIYYIKVYNEDSLGKYSLAIGKIESFPPEESVNSLFSLPRIKSEFFNKPWWTAFTSKVGPFLLIPVIIFAILILLAIWIVRKYGCNKIKDDRELV
jgi:hypothetical protein